MLPLLRVQLGVVVQGLHDDKVVAHLVSQAWEIENFTNLIHPLAANTLLHYWHKEIQKGTNTHLSDSKTLG